jgi:hypothetical protein
VHLLTVSVHQETTYWGGSIANQEDTISNNKWRSAEAIETSASALMFQYIRLGQLVNRWKQLSRPENETV